MEILSPNFTSIALNITLLLSALSGGVLLVITGVHWQIVRDKKHTTTFRQAAEPLIASYLAGHTTEQTVIEAMQKDPPEALSLLIKFSLKLKRAMRSRLLPLHASILMVDTEIAALKSSHIKRRVLAAEHLGYFKSTDSSEALLKALDDDVLAVRFSAAHSLAAHGKLEAIEPILLALDIPDQMHWQRVVEVILDYGLSAAPIIFNVLENSKEIYSNNIVNVAIRTLGLFRTPEALQPLIKLLDNPDYSIRLNAAHALGQIGDPAAIVAVAKLADDPAWRVRNEAVDAIGQLHAEKQIPILLHALTDSSWWVRFSAAQALHSLGQAGIIALKEVMKNTVKCHARDICRQVLEEHHIFDTKKNPS